MKHYNIFLALFVSVLLFSCREENPAVFNPQDENVFKSWDDVFESYWNGMNYSYAFWEVDPTDWDAVYREYKPRFQELEFNSSEDSATVKVLFEEITANLIDHHYALILYKDEKRPWCVCHPASQEIKKRDYYHDEFSESNLINTIVENRKKGRIKDLKSTFISGTGNDMNMYSYCIDNCIAYLRLNSFAISSNWGNPDLLGTLQNFFRLIENTPDLKGVVIDTRNNGGGTLSDMYFILSPLITEEVTFGYTCTKNGMGRLDYTPWSPLVLYPVSKAGGDLEGMDEVFPPIKRNLENIPIIALADLHSLSMGELTPMAICALPNGCFIGERTQGGHGPISNNLNDSYAGAFENEAFRVYTSTSLTKNLDGNIYEGIGLTPDIEALYNETEFLKGNDTQLERAIQYIHTGK